MSFRNNLQHLRATRNMTQEQLAMLVGVSRQSVTKWEAERAYPEMDKLIKLTQIFDCTIDELVSGDLTTRAPETGRAISAAAAPIDVCGYDEHEIKLARNIALGVAVILLGLSGMIFLGEMEPRLAMLSLYGGLAIGVAIMILTAIADSSYQRSHPFIEDFYTSEQKDRIRRAFGFELTGGLVVVFLSVALLAWSESQLAGTLFFVGIAIGVPLIVHAGILVDRIDVEGYNIDALSELNEEEVSSIVGEERAATVLAKVRRNRLTGIACGIIMLLATIVGVCLMFLEVPHFWLAWAVGGLLCGVAVLVPELVSSLARVR